MVDFSAFDLLCEEMENEEIYSKVNAVHRLKIVILSIDKKEVESKLIPFIDKLIDQEDDEVLFAIAEELGKCYQLLDDKLVFLPLLEKLARSDETVVREQAAQSLIQISEHLSDAQIQQNFSELIIRLASADWFTGRVSSTKLFEYAYPSSGQQKERLRKKFAELCQEDTPMIRRACAKQIGSFSKVVEKQKVAEEFFEIIKNLAKDEQDQIRVLCLESLIPIAKILSKEENKDFTLRILIAASEDKSWKVRLCFAKRFADFSSAIGQEITENDLINKFSDLLDDQEPEVKNSAIYTLSQTVTGSDSIVLEQLSADKVCNILFPKVKSVYSESQTHYKAGVALALSEMAKVSGKDFTKEEIMPILTELTNDDNAEVRLNVMQNLHKVADVIGSDIVSPSFIAILTKITKDPQWRVRMANIRLLGSLSIQLGKEVYTKSFESIFMSYLTNSAASVREMGNTMVQEMASKFGKDWVEKNFLPKVLETYDNEKNGFNYRMACLGAMGAVLPESTKDSIKTQIVPTIVKACKDTVPNVQFCAERLIYNNKKFFGQEIFQKDLAPELNKNTGDADKDVAYWAVLALQNP